jgi:SAM-dependent methyltransferase
MRWSYDTGGGGGLLASAQQALAEKGAAYVLRLGGQRLTFPLWGAWRRRFPRTFTWQGRSYPYFFHPYNLTWSNERAVEVPIVRDLVLGHRGRPVLEVGNVLAHYFPVEHDVLDKFERGPGVVNEDVVDFRSARRYDLIVSISTLEHVGWDEAPRDPAKVLRALDNLAGHLAPGGRLVATLPLGYNPPLDALLAAGALPWSRRTQMKRRGKVWSEAEWGEVAGSGYGRGRPGTDGLVIGIIER